MMDGIRRALGMVITPSIDHLTTYRAKVVAQSADLLTVDLQADDPRIGTLSAVPILMGLPAATASITAGCFVRLGWRAGDPRQPYVTSWESGAHANKTVIPADTVYLGAEAAAQFVALANKVGTELSAIVNAFNSHQHLGVVTGGGTSGAPSTPMSSPSSTAAAQVKAK